MLNVSFEHYLYKEAYEEEWVNPQNCWGNHSIASMVFGANPLFFGGLNIYYITYLSYLIIYSKSLRYY